MINALRRTRTWVAFFSLAGLAGAAAAQTQAPTTLDKVLSHVDLGLSVMGALNSSTSGPAGPEQTQSNGSMSQDQITDSPSTTGGALITLRYIKSPLVGVEFNYTYARDAQHYTGLLANPVVSPTFGLVIQNSVHEYTFGWVFHTPQVFGFHTFVSAGGGTTAFKPTTNGGLNYQEQARATYYYDAGVEQQIINPHLGFRAAFRQSFYLAPDFETTYLQDHKHTSSLEPNVGIYIHF